MLRVALCVSFVSAVTLAKAAELETTHIFGFTLGSDVDTVGDVTMTVLGRFCSLIPGLGVELSNDILAGPTVLSAVGVSPPHDGVR